MVAESLGDRLRRLRDEADLSQDALGAQIGMTGQAIYMIEAGERKRPRKSTIEKLARVLGVSPAYLEYGLVEQGGEQPDGHDEAASILSRLDPPFRAAALRHLRIVAEMQAAYLAAGTMPGGSTEEDEREPSGPANQPRLLPPGVGGGGAEAEIDPAADTVAPPTEEQLRGMAALGEDTLSEEAYRGAGGWVDEEAP